MKTKRQQINSHASFLSIDEWQDDEPLTGSRFDNPFLGTLGLIGAVVCLFSWSALSSPQGEAGVEQFGEDVEAVPRQPESPMRSEPGNVDEALAGLNGNFLEPSLRYFGNRANFDPGQKKVAQDKILTMLATNPSDLDNYGDVFSIWFDTEDHSRISTLIKKLPGYEFSLVTAMSKLPNPIPALVSELAKHPPTSMAHEAIAHELRTHAEGPDEISRQLANKLSSTANPHEFERIVLVLKYVAQDTSDNPALKKEIAEAMAVAGRNLTIDQLEKMDSSVAVGIKMLAQTPENTDLLEKLAATKHGAGKVQMSFGQTRNTASHLEPGDDESAVRLVRENKIAPRALLRYEDSELVQEFLWEGKLKRKSEFLNLNLHPSPTSMKAFSKAGVSLINSDGHSAIDSLLSVVQKHSKEITRERMSDEFLQKLDILLASKLKVDLRLSADSSDTGNKRSTVPKKMTGS